jgi:hypothetical protein
VEDVVVQIYQVALTQLTMAHQVVLEVVEHITPQAVL